MFAIPHDSWKPFTEVRDAWKLAGIDEIPQLFPVAVAREEPNQLFECVLVGAADFLNPFKCTLVLWSPLTAHVFFSR